VSVPDSNNHEPDETLLTNINQKRKQIIKLLSANKEFLPFLYLSYEKVCLDNSFIVILYCKENTIHLHYKEVCLKGVYGKASLSVLVTRGIRLINNRYTCLPLLLKGGLQSAFLYLSYDKVC